MKRIDYRPLPLSFFPPTRNLPSLCHTMPSLVWWRRKDRGRESLSQPSLPSRSILPSFSCPSGCHSPSPSQSALVFSFSIVTWKQLARESERAKEGKEGKSWHSTGRHSITGNGHRLCSLPGIWDRGKDGRNGGND